MLNETILKLHDRATRGEQLTAEEQAQLEHWYAVEDETEMQLLAQSITQTSATSFDISSLQAQLETALSQLATTTQQIQQITLENKALRQEIAELKQRLFKGNAA